MTQRSAVNGFRSAYWRTYGSNVMQPYRSPVQLAFVIPASFSCSDGKFSRFQQNYQLSAALSGGVAGVTGHVVEILLDMCFFLRHLQDVVLSNKSKMIHP